MNLTLTQKQTLQTLLQSGNLVSEVAYDPTVVTPGVPEAAAEAEGWTVWYQSNTPTLNETIFTMTAPDGVDTSVTT